MLAVAAAIFLLTWRAGDPLRHVRFPYREDASEARRKAYVRE